MKTSIGLKKLSAATAIKRVKFGLSIIAVSGAATLLSAGSVYAQADPTIYNQAIPAGRANFDAMITGVGGTVFTDALSGLSSASSWTRPDYTITSTDGSSRSIDSSYLASPPPGGIPGGQSIGISPQSPAPSSGLTFTFNTPINAFGLDIGDWSTCCHPSALYISFDGGATKQVAVATTASDNPGYAAYGTYANFVGAIDDSATFSTITFYGDGFGEYLVAGGVIRYGTVRTGSVTGVPEHSSPVTLVAVGLGLAGLGVLRRRRQFSKLDAYLNSNQN